MHEILKKKAQQRLLRSFTPQNGWHTRGYLPHYHNDRVIQFITFGLDDALPWKHCQKLVDTTSTVNESKKVYATEQREHLLDLSYGECLLRYPEFATIVESSILFFDSVRYTIYEWIIMPNHVHILMSVHSGYTLSKILQSIKSFSSRAINATRKKNTPLWRPDYYDRYIRDQRHFDQVTEYITMNPVRAQLCNSPHEWRFSSSYHQNCTVDKNFMPGQ